jgi:hypothetical protein
MLHSMPTMFSSLVQAVLDLQVVAGHSAAVPYDVYGSRGCVMGQDIAVFWVGAESWFVTVVCMDGGMRGVSVGGPVSTVGAEA